jgi:hypothetical protein
MTRYPTSTAVVESVPVLPWPSEGNEADRQAFWDRRTAGYAEARVRADAINAEGKLDAVVTTLDPHDSDRINIIGAPADGVRRIVQYNGTDDTTRWGVPNRGIWWIEASFSSTGLPGHVGVSAYFNSVEERDAATARYPKNLKVRATYLLSGDKRIPCATLNVGLWSDKVNGGRNETGIARFRRFLALTQNIGWAAVYGNAFPNLASLLAVID